MENPHLPRANPNGGDKGAAGPDTQEVRSPTSLKYARVYGATSMVKLPTPPWAHRRETCPNCLERIADKKSLVCIRCGYQLRVPFVALVGLVAIAGGIGGLIMSAFGGDVIPWPAMPVKIPFLENPTAADLRTLSAWLGGLALLLGSALAFAGAYMIRRRSDRVLRGGRPA